MSWSRLARSAFRASRKSLPPINGRHFPSVLGPIATSTVEKPSGIEEMASFKFGSSRGISTARQYQFLSTERAAEDDSDSEDDASDVNLRGLGPTKPGEKPRVVVLGTGWAACSFLKLLDTKLYDVVCISPRNHMVFTPLLASTCVGTLEFRSVAEPVSRIQSALAGDPNSYFYLATCTGIDSNKHEVS